MTTSSPLLHVAFEASGADWSVTVERGDDWAVHLETAYPLVDPDEALRLASALVTASVVCRELRAGGPRKIANVGELAYRLGVDTGELLAELDARP